MTSNYIRSQGKKLNVIISNLLSSLTDHLWLDTTILIKKLWGNPQNWQCIWHTSIAHVQITDRIIHYLKKCTVELVLSMTCPRQELSWATTWNLTHHGVFHFNWSAWACTSSKQALLMLPLTTCFEQVRLHMYTGYHMHTSENGVHRTSSW